MHRLILAAAFLCTVTLLLGCSSAEQPQPAEGTTATAPADADTEVGGEKGAGGGSATLGSEPSPSTTTESTSTSTPSDSPTDDGAAGPVDRPALRFVTRDFNSALVLRPADFLSTPVVRDTLGALDKELPEGSNPSTGMQLFTGVTGIEPNKVAEIMVLASREMLGEGSEILAAPAPPEELPSLPALVITFNEPIDPQQIVDRLPLPAEPASHGGKSFYRLGEFGGLYATGDNQVYLAAPEPLLKKMMDSDAATASPLRSQLATIGKKHVTLLVDTTPLQELARREAETLPPLQGMDESVTSAEQFLLTLDFQDDTLLNIETTMPDEATATQLAGAAQGFFDQLTQRIDADRDKAEEMFHEAGDPFYSMFDAVVAVTNIGSQENRFQVRVQRPKTLGELPQLVAASVKAARKIGERNTQANNLRMIGLALHTYHDMHGSFPSASGPADSNGGLSWRVYLLPFLEEQELFDKFNLDEAWDSENNKQLISQMPSHFGDDPDGRTNLHVFTGSGVPFGEKKLSIGSITDGTANTIGIVRAGPDTADVWTKPGGLKFNPEDPLAAVGQVGDKFMVMYFDISIGDIPKSIDPEQFRRLVQHADGEPVEVP